MTELHRRVQAAQSTLDLYLGKPLEWGRFDCARMAAHTLKALGRKAPLARFGAYSSAVGAIRALRRAGFTDLGQAVDSFGLLRIPPASALPADIIGLAAEDLPMSLAVALSNGRVLGFHADHEGAVVMQPTAYLAAWRAL
jgi:hypothetical protein